MKNSVEGHILRRFLRFFFNLTLNTYCCRKLSFSVFDVLFLGSLTSSHNIITCVSVFYFLLSLNGKKSVLSYFFFTHN